MRFLIANAFFVSFVLHLQGIEGADTEEEWDDLLQKFRPKAKPSELTYGNQTTGDDATTDGPEEEGSEEEEAIKGVSLAFVFDTTGSMNDELTQVKEGASQILAALRDHPDAPIYNYIWMPFNDPEIGPITVTTDHQLFQQSIESVKVAGGADCPEMSIGAIKQALEASLPNSYIYVFTDASAKDYDLQEEVLTLVQRKQAQIDFILTDDCRDLDQPTQKVYEKIAETSSGQIYRLNRDEVNDVLKYVKLSLQPNKVSLGFLSKPTPDKENPDKIEFDVDDALKQLTFSVSGKNATIDLTDPKGVKVDSPPKLENVLDLENIKVVKVNDPDPGPWKVLINSDSPYIFRTTGLSKVNFEHGFSTTDTVNLKETNKTPLKGAKSFLLVKAPDEEKKHNVTGVDLVGLNGNVFRHLDLSPVPDMPGLYKADSFEPPSDFFYLGDQLKNSVTGITAKDFGSYQDHEEALRLSGMSTSSYPCEVIPVTGVGPDGRRFKRVTTTALNSQPAKKPVITARGRAFRTLHTSGYLKCYVESAVPFTTKWFKNGVDMGEEKTCRETCEVILNFDNFTSEAEGVYSCGAENVAGKALKSMILVVSDHSPSVKVSKSVSSFIGCDVYLDCLVESHIPYQAKWMHYVTRDNKSGVLHPVSRGVTLPNDTLLIESATPEDEGKYECHAVNENGEAKAEVVLTIYEPLLLKIIPSSQAFLDGDTARFRCYAFGKSQPTFEWFKDDEPLKQTGSSAFVMDGNGTSTLIINYLKPKDTGLYTCSAYIGAQTVSATAELIDAEKPRVKARKKNLVFDVGDLAVLECSADGHPEPTISWFKGTTEIRNSDKYEVEGGVLTIHSATTTDTGMYSCVGKSDIGSAKDFISIIVRTPNKKSPNKKSPNNKSPNNSPNNPIQSPNDVYQQK